MKVTFGSKSFSHDENSVLIIAEAGVNHDGDISKAFKLIDIAFHNLLATDYPKDKIEWVVIEDNEKTPHIAVYADEHFFKTRWDEQMYGYQHQIPHHSNISNDILKFEPKQGAARLEKLLLSAIANWQNKNEDIRLEDADLYVKEIKVDSGRMLKRLRPAPQGRAHRIRKRSNHVTMVVANAAVVEVKTSTNDKEK